MQAKNKARATTVGNTLFLHRQSVPTKELWYAICSLTHRSARTARYTARQPHSHKNTEPNSSLTRLGCSHSSTHRQPAACPSVQRPLPCRPPLHQHAVTRARPRAACKIENWPTAPAKMFADSSRIDCELYVYTLRGEQISAELDLCVHGS